MDVPEAVNTYVKTWNAQDLDGWLANFAPDGTYSDPVTGNPISGQALKDHFQGLVAGFPAWNFDTADLHQINESLAVWRWVMRATNSGSYRGMPPTGRTVTLPGVEFIEVKSGKVTRAEGYFDRMTMLAQLGLLPAPPTPGSE